VLAPVMLDTVRWWESKVRIIQLIHIVKK